MFNYPFAPVRPEVPYQFPQVSWLKLSDYLDSLLTNYGGVRWPLDDVANNPYARVINTAVAKGRNIEVDSGFDTPGLWGTPTGWSVTGGKMVATAAATGFNASQGTAAALGHVFEITYDLVVTSGSVQVRLAGGIGTTRAVSGTFTETLLTSAGNVLNFVPVTTFTGSFDNLTIKELNIPASNAVPVQLLNTDVWNGLGVGAWTPAANATVTAVSTTRHDGSTGTVLKIARSTTTNPEASQSLVLVANVPNRIIGWAQGDGTGAPRIIVNGVTYFTGAATAAWQSYDFVVVPAVNSTIRFLCFTSSGTTFCLFDTTTVALDTGIRADNPVVNSTFAVDANWAKGTGWTIAGGVAHHDNTDITGSVVSQANVMVVGKRYLVTYTVSNYVQGQLQIFVSVPNSTFGQVVTANGTYSDVIIATGTNINVQNRLAGTPIICDVDNVTIQEISPLVGLPVNGVISGNVESNRLLNSYSFDKVNDYVSHYSAQLNSIYPINAGTAFIFGQIDALGTWSDGVARELSQDGIDGTNGVFIFKTAVTGQLQCNYTAGGTAKSVAFASGSPTGWFMVAITWDTVADQMKVYFNGVQVGSTQTGLGVWAGNLTAARTVLAATINTPSGVWGGRLTVRGLIDTALSASEVAEIAKLGDAA